MLEYSKLILEAEKAINWIKDYVESCNADGVVIGNSGGKDSATVIAMAVRALGKDKVLTVAMPCNSIKEDLEDAKLVSMTFEVPFIEVDLSNSYNQFENDLNNVLKSSLGKELVNESKVNSKPRFRMTTLYSIAQTMNYLVIGTGNLCEQMVGYTTKWGDSASDFNPIGNFTVREVLAIGKYLGVPDKIISKKPSDGLGIKTDEEKMGVTYDQIEEYIETGKTDPEAMKIIERKNKVSKHKRMLVPKYMFDRTNYLS
jgi:NAD+ synthase